MRMRKEWLLISKRYPLFSMIDNLVTMKKQAEKANALRSTKKKKQKSLFDDIQFPSFDVEPNTRYSLSMENFL